jgi:hypothetical protein
MLTRRFAAQGRRLALLFGTSCTVKRLLELTDTKKFACAEERDEAIALARTAPERTES